MIALIQRLAIRQSASVCLAGLLSAFASSTIFAADITWNGGAGNWSTAANWSGGVPVAGDTAIIGAGGNPQITSNVGELSMFQVGAASVTMTGGSLISRGLGGAGVPINGSMNLGPVAGGKGTFNMQGGTLQFGEEGAPGTNDAGDHGWAYIGGSGGNIFGGGGTGAGEFNLSGGEVTFHQRIMLGYRGAGVLNQTGGTLIAKGNNAYNDAIGLGDQNGSTGVYNLSGGTAEFTGAFRVGNWEGSGEVNISNNAQMNVIGELSVGSEAGDAGNSGLVNQQSGDVSVGSLLIAQSGTSVGTYNLTSGTFYVETTSEIGRDGDAEFVQTGGIAELFEPVIAVSADSTSAYRLHGGTLDLAYSSISVGAGQGTFDFQGGELRAATNVKFSLVNAGGAISPGNGIGETIIEGDYTVTSVNAAVNIELASTSSFDELSVTGAIDLDGILNVSLLNNFAPSLGNTFTFLTGASLSGTFADANFPTLGAGLGWDVIYNANSVAIKVVEQNDVPGDTNGDGVVNIVDLNNVRNNFGANGNPILGDTAPFDGAVTIADLNNVRNNFGTGGVSQSVPEPSGIALAVACFGMLGATAYRRKTK
jgi:hypothetical protein